MGWPEMHAEADRIETLHPRPIALREDSLPATKGINALQLMTMTFPPIQYVVPGYIAEGLTVFAGAPKIGKSWLMLGVALAVAAGMPAFGSVPCQAGDVLYLALEDNPRRLQRRLLQMHPGTVPDRLTFMTSWPDLDNGCLEEIITWLAYTPEARLVIIDVFAKVKGNAASGKPQYEVDYEAATGLQQLAGKYGVAIVLVHHTRKMEADDPFDSVSGTRGLTGAADTVLVLKRDAAAQHPTLYGRGRDIEEIEVAMQFDREFGTWSVLGDAGMIAKTSERQELLDALAQAGEPLGATDLAATVGKKRDNVQHLLKRLLIEGKVLCPVRGKYTPVTPFTPFTNDGLGSGHSEHCERSERGLGDCARCDGEGCSWCGS